MVTELLRSPSMLFVKSKHHRHIKMSHLKIGLLPIFVVNWMFGVSIIEYPLEVPRFLISVAVYFIVYIEYGHLFFTFWNQFTEKLMKLNLDNFQYNLLSIYYLVVGSSFIGSMIIGLYNSEV